MGEPDQRDRRSANLFAVITILAVLLLGLAGWWLFPRLQAYVSFQDCVATGRANCSGP